MSAYAWECRLGYVSVNEWECWWVYELECQLGCLLGCSSECESECQLECQSEYESACESASGLEY